MKKFGFSFSHSRALGITGMKHSCARKTCVPTTRGGLERKLGSMLINSIFGKK